MGMTNVAGNPILHVRNAADVAEFMAAIKPNTRLKFTFHSSALGAVYCLKEMHGELLEFEPHEAERLRLICNSNSWGDCGRQFTATVVRVAPTMVANIIGRSLASIELVRAAE